MKNVSFAAGVLLAALLAGCSGGGTSTPTPPAGGGASAPTPTPTPIAATPTPSPAPSSTPVAAATPLGTATINGSPAFVTATGFATYFFDGDTTADVSTCTGSCLAAWPPVLAPSGALPSPWSEFTRTDTNQLQLAFNGRPLYTFASDTSPGVATGDGVAGFSLARPTATALADPTPTPSATPYSGYAKGTSKARPPH
ncbi:MAG TPA: hypothetical protein VMD91_07490 [Candidatus Sulfotelmatobacter sp.]|nr:hypothetical protein [Candidatus Sulfotelmatobacter sp.]